MPTTRRLSSEESVLLEAQVIFGEWQTSNALRLKGSGHKHKSLESNTTSAPSGYKNTEFVDYNPLKPTKDEMPIHLALDQMRSYHSVFVM